MSEISEIRSRVTKHGEKIAILETLFPQLKDSLDILHKEFKDLATEVRSSGAINSQLLEVGERVAISLEQKVELTKNSGRDIISSYLYGMGPWQKWSLSVMLIVLVGALYADINPSQWGNLISKG